jgi:hypothetical protein
MCDSVSVIAVMCCFCRAGVKLIAGETAEHAYGGLLGVTNKFVGSFFYAAQLGFLAQAGVSNVARQTLAGGAYALLERKTNGGWLPRSDYWVATLWRRLIVGDSTDVRVVMAHRLSQPAPGVLVFAFCSSALQSGEAVGKLVVVNLDRRRGVEIQPLWEGCGSSGSGGRQAQREEWHMTGNVSVAAAVDGMRVNGQSPWLSGGEVAPRRADPGSNLTVGAASIAFALQALAGLSAWQHHDT